MKFLGYIPSEELSWGTRHPASGAHGGKNISLSIRVIDGLQLHQRRGSDFQVWRRTAKVSTPILRYAARYRVIYVQRKVKGLGVISWTFFLSERHVSSIRWIRTEIRKLT